ncbi:aminodeoxychorismate synthase component I [Scleromatobacter humisilvae]|uniref:Aminodeoxychorismate synthase component I n=1 Tax=Scleromatobacter humisilvae TaxID=2897159 RepID=A0A9X2BXR4_9BURK|nr:aminodeoxychorismate synthase component I [Scleromatobacter humisilvae]MCK9684677.1 aminodeoxychorismate synthase component I [Scleromatobacter humisilvae]
MSAAGPRPTALIDFRSPDDGVAPLRLAFGAPRELLRATSLDAVAPLLARVDALARAGAWCVGYLCYEAAGAFDEAFETHAPSDPARPLAAFAVYDAPLSDDAAFDDAGTATVRWTGGPRRDAFDTAIAEILRAIADGEVYQVNATAPLTGTLHGDPLALFAALRRAQPNAYAAYLDFGNDTDDRILSVSPELFFDWRGDRMLARPMKGTAPRGATPEEDAAQSAHLRSAAKERAENLMIVDLLRNDLSRIAEPHSVRVPRLFHTEAWPTVWQMSSDVVATTRPGTTLADVFGALFPCGSITGAPKVQAMRLIRELEPEPRGIYCGAVGVVQPGGAATFNVPIRTLALRGDAVRCGIGSGITADATAAGEWDEWRHKRAFVDRASQAFELLETLRLEDGEFVDVEAHLARMAEAAAHFAFAPPLASARGALAELRAAHASGRWRVRLLADRAGVARAQAFALAPTQAPVRVRLAERPFAGSDGEFVRFKTTQRAHYDAFAPAGEDVFDTLLWNERGELTEFTRGNVALRIAGRWLTPSSKSGLLPGIARARLLREGVIEEAVLTRDDLARADGVAFFNSLRGWLGATLAP